MVVDDLQDLCLIETGDRLRDLVVIDQNHALAARLQQVIARERADDMLVFIEDGVAAVAAFQDDLTDVIDKIRQVERLKLLGAADALDGDRVKDHARGLESVIGRGDDAGVGGRGPQILRQLCLTDDQAAHAKLDGAARHLRLLAADDDAVFR